MLVFSGMITDHDLARVIGRYRKTIHMKRMCVYVCLCVGVCVCVCAGLWVGVSVCLFVSL